MDVKDAKQYIKVREGSLLPPSNISLSHVCLEFLVSTLDFLHP